MARRSAKGKIIDSRDAGKRFVTNGKDEAAEFTDFDVPEIVAAIRAGDEGLREIVRDGRPVVIAFVRLDALDWYYVVEVDGGTLGVPPHRTQKTAARFLRSVLLPGFPPANAWHCRS